MKKLAILLATVSFALATPVLACPHDDGAPKTAEKTKGNDSKAKDAPKADKTDTATAKKKEEPKQDTAKKPDKVSQK